MIDKCVSEEGCGLGLHVRSPNLVECFSSDPSISMFRGKCVASGCMPGVRTLLDASDVISKENEGLVRWLLGFLAPWHLVFSCDFLVWVLPRCPTFWAAWLCLGALFRSVGLANFPAVFCSFSLRFFGFLTPWASRRPPFLEFPTSDFPRFCSKVVKLL